MGWSVAQWIGRPLQQQQLQGSMIGSMAATTEYLGNNMGKSAAVNNS
jgi:hypothetical protein